MFYSLVWLFAVRIFLLWSFSLWLKFTFLDLNSQFSSRSIPKGGETSSGWGFFELCVIGMCLKSLKRSRRKITFCWEKVVYCLFLNSLDISGCMLGVCMTFRCGIILSSFLILFRAAKFFLFAYLWALHSVHLFNEDKVSNLFWGRKQDFFYSFCCSCQSVCCCQMHTK